ncbi:MAG: PilW family protein [Dokdonella sp.]
MAAAGAPSSYSPHSSNAPMSHGFSLIELMVALLLGVLLIEGIAVLISQTHRVNSIQAAVARLQENGRSGLQALVEDLRRAAHMPCGSRMRPLVYADALAAHIAGVPVAANAPAGWPADTPYPLSRSLFIHGHTCAGTTCTPAITAEQELPPVGLNVGERVIGTDVLTVRSLHGSGWAIDATIPAQACDTHPALATLTLRATPSNDAPATFTPGHLALLANCSAGEIFKPQVRDNALQPLREQWGQPACFPADSQTRVFDLDTQLQTSVYYLQLKSRAGNRGVAAPVLVRRTNGVSTILAEGVERLDFRYSLIDAAEAAHWLTAAEVDQATDSNGVALTCKTAQAANATRPCDWSDINAVDISMLVNSVDELPPDPSAHAWAYHYAIDGEKPQSPARVMPVTDLPAGRMQRREFHSVVALRDMTP